MCCYFVVAASILFDLRCRGSTMVLYCMAIRDDDVSSWRVMAG